MAKGKIGEIISYEPTQAISSEHEYEETTFRMVRTAIGLVEVKTWSNNGTLGSGAALEAYWNGISYHYLADGVYATKRQAVRLAREFAAEVMKLAKGKK